ncbi:unnamed protein product [Camellia sinensis]
MRKEGRMRKTACGRSVELVQGVYTNEEWSNFGALTKPHTAAQGEEQRRGPSENVLEVGPGKVFLGFDFWYVNLKKTNEAESVGFSAAGAAEILERVLVDIMRIGGFVVHCCVESGEPA